MTKQASILLTSGYPLLVSQWNFEKNLSIEIDTVTASSGRKVWWKCDKGHEWEALVFNRTQGRNCPYCSGRLAVKGETDLLSQNPLLASQWHPTKNGTILADEVTIKASKKVWWKCNNDHEWEATVSSRTKGNGCPYCGKRKVLSSFNDLSTLYPLIALQWHPTKNKKTTPEMVMPSSTHKAWWLCEEGHEYEAIIGNRTRNSGCPFCAHKKVELGISDLSTTNPELLGEWDYTKNSILPNVVFPYSKKEVWWKCLTNPLHEWKAKISARVTGTGCPYCSGKKIHIGSNDMASQNPILAAQWSSRNGILHSDMVTISSSKKVWWTCPTDAAHEWETWVYQRTKGSGCPHCNSAQVVSKAEGELRNVLSQLGFDATQNSRTLLPPKREELDLYIPSLNFAIEFNGLYWHSELFKTKDYHLDKWQACSNAGITLYQVWEDDWNFRRDIVIQGIAHRLGVVSLLNNALPDLPGYWSEKIGARKTRVTILDYSSASIFLDAHHIQGSVTGTYYLGLKDIEDRIRAVLVLSSTGILGELRIDRYATAGVVSGGFTKLLKAAELSYKPKRWITFADRAISTGGLYDLTGFHVDKIIKPDYTYLVKGKRVHKFNYRINRFKTDPSLIYEENKTEKELAEMNNLIRIWDSGKMRYIKDVIIT